MALSELAGKLAPAENLLNVAKLVADYYSVEPDVTDVAQRVKFGTSGHRGCASVGSFNDAHIAAISQALAEYRHAQNITGPCYLGMDTHALSEPALNTTLEVLVANGVTVICQANRGYTPTPVISFNILQYNAQGQGFADGVVLTPSHNPPEDGGYKYNGTHGGPADTEATKAIEARANEIMRAGNIDVQRVTLEAALASELYSEIDFAPAYIAQLDQVIDMPAIAQANLSLAADPMGGAGYQYYALIAQHYGLNITVVNNTIDHRFAFMPCDKDGKIRMDCSSPYAMAGLLSYKDHYDLAFGNDTDFDRHGIVTPAGLMNPNHFLAVAIDYLLGHRPAWASTLRVGKTLVSSAMIDKVIARHQRTMAEMPVGFKWFVAGLTEQTICFAGEESAGGIFLRRNGQPWGTDKDGFILCLLAAEILAVTGKNPQQHYDELCAEFGTSFYQRIDVPCTLSAKDQLSQLDASAISADKIAGETIINMETHAAGNQAAIGGLKVSTTNGWFAARPSGTENVYKIYAESFVSDDHLQNLLTDAQKLVNDVLS